jgi:hypothetical protein
MMLAQEQLAGLPDTFWKNFCIGLLVLLGAAVAIVTLWALTRKPEPQRLNDDPPIEIRKSPKRFNYELSEQRHGDHERRILQLEKTSNELLKKLDADKQEILDAGEERGDKIKDHVEAVRRELDEKIDNIPDRVIATLKNTGAI